ncbi:MAG: hypothetical protein R3332_11740 [Pseudohongiellaceae bacterium]|nr:hypothetical protein [Pseudohongiellaceae bacterium]
MHKLLRLTALSIAIASAHGASWAQDSSEEALAILVPGGGSYSRPSSINSELAQQFFDQGLRMAWSFYFPESIASYQEASRLDPDNPMPYFGLAHAAGPNPNSRYARLPDDPQGAGLAAIRKALSLAGNGSAIEQDMINALFVLYNKDAIPDQRERDFAYLDAMRALHAKYPNDADIATMFAEGYMNTTRWDYWNADGSPKPGTAEAQAALEAAMRVEHDHPGANHLYIHLMEASSQPELAMAAAQKLESTVPISGHMVHMPGHIYLRVGEYEKAIDINERSQIVDQQFAEIWGNNNFPNIGTYGLSHKSHAPHALDFVRYANMLQGNYAEAYAAAKRGADSVGVAVEAVNRGQKRVVNWWLTDKIFGKWDNILSAEQSHSGTPYLDGMWSYVRGSALIASGNLEQAQNELDNLRAQAADPAVDAAGVGPTPASHILTLAGNALEGELKEAQGDLMGAIAAYSRAVELQDANNYTEPPDWSQSIRLYLGAALLAAGEPERAESVYRQELEWSQQNGWASFGLYQALEAQDRQHEAEIAKRQFESYWRNADVSLSRSRL